MWLELVKVFSNVPKRMYKLVLQCGSYDQVRVIWYCNPLLSAAWVSVHDCWCLWAVSLSAVRSGEARLVPLLMVIVWRANALGLAFANSFFICCCYFKLYGSHMGNNPFQSHRHHSSDRGQAKRRRDNGSAGRASEIKRTEQGSSNREMPPPSSKWKVVPIPCRENKEAKCIGKERSLHGPALDEEEKEYVLTRDVAKGVPARKNWDWLEVLKHIGFWKYLNAESFGLLLMKGHDFCISAKRLTRVRAHLTFNLRECSRGAAMETGIEDRNRSSFCWRARRSGVRAKSWKVVSRDVVRASTSLQARLFLLCCDIWSYSIFEFFKGMAGSIIDEVHELGR